MAERSFRKRMVGSSNLLHPIAVLKNCGNNGQRALGSTVERLPCTNRPTIPCEQGVARSNRAESTRTHTITAVGPSYTWLTAVRLRLGLLLLSSKIETILTLTYLSTFIQQDNNK